MAGPEPGELANHLGDQFLEQLESKFSEYRELHYNPNTKGGSYEEAVRGFLELYFGNVYELRTRTAVIDSRLEILNRWTPEENEVDVLGLFRQSVPRIVLESGEMEWVPYPAVAFGIEVKSTLTAGNLEQDVEKLSVLRDLSLGADRFGALFSGQFTYNPQFLGLVYDQEEIAADTCRQILEEHSEIWNFVLVVEDDAIAFSPITPLHEVGVSQGAHGPDEVAFLGMGLGRFVTAISVSIPQPPTVASIGPLLSILEAMGEAD